MPESLTQDRWRRIEELFDGALDRTANSRKAWLDAECAGDPDLRAQVERLLAAAPQAAGAMESAVAHSLQATLRPPAEPARDRIGAYVILSEIGRGGQGVVYLARRDDDVFHKQVAIKVVKRGMDTDQILSRFRHERRILARLDHPNIARILDGGSTEDGLPYLVMEYVAGVSITSYCEQRKLPLRARVELFRRVCAAVEYAHRNLVVHRDLKPSNILVDESGEPRLLDFGIAKLLGDTGSGESTVTAEGARLLTPRYASPEQVSGEPITTASDVYSLGTILYELLTGAAAHRITASTPASIARAVCEEEIPAPSACPPSGTLPYSLSQLAGDLDNILLTALRKDRRERYGSAEQFSEDLFRYLNNLPVLARPQTLGYRGAKFLRRHRVPVVAAALVAASLIGGIAFASYQAARAQRRFQDIRGLANSMLFGVHDRIQNLAGATEAREWAVRTAVEYLDKLSRDAGDDRDLLFELATAYQKVGDVQGYPRLPNLGHMDAAIVSHRKALSIAERLAKVDSSPRVRRLLAFGHQRLGVVVRTNNLAEAFSELELAAAAIEPLYAAHTGDPADSELLALVFNSLGETELLRGHAEEANRDWSRALEAASQWAGVDPSDNALAALGQAHRVMCRGLTNVGDLERAEREARESLRIREALMALQPANAVFRRDVMNGHVELAYVYSRPHRVSFREPQVALPYQLRALAIAQELSSADRSNTLAQTDLAIAHGDLCDVLATIDPARALEHCRASLAIADRYSQLFRGNRSVVHASQAVAYRTLGRRREALEELSRALAGIQEILKLDPTRADLRILLAPLRSEMAELLAESGERAAALEQHRQARELAEAWTVAEPKNPQAQAVLADCYQRLGRYHAASDPAEAREWIRKSLEVWTAWPRIAPSTRMDQARRTELAAELARLGGR